MQQQQHACVECGIDISHRGARAERCEACKAERTRDYQRKYRITNRDVLAKNQQERRPRKALKACLECGESLEDRGPQAKYCVPCGQARLRRLAKERKNLSQPHRLKNPYIGPRAKKNGVPKVIKAVPVVEKNGHHVRGDIDSICQLHHRMSDAEERGLIAQAQAGCVESRDRLIENNLPFLISKLVKKYDRYRYEELLGTATLGMVRAIEKYDLDRNIRLISYATWWIMGQVNKQVYDDSTIYSPDSRKSNGTFRGFHYVPYDGPKDSGGDEDDDNLSLANVLADETIPRPDDAAAQGEIAGAIAECIDKLKPLQREIIRRRWGFDGKGYRPHEDVAREMGGKRSKQAVHQNEAEAFKNLKRLLFRRGIMADVLDVYV